MALDAADVDEALGARRPRGADQRHAPVAARRVRGLPMQAAELARGVGRQGGVRRRLPPGALGPDRAATSARTASWPHEAVTAILQRVLPLCDLVVGTEEEIHILGGVDRHASRRCGRSASAPDALLVCKRGPRRLRRPSPARSPTASTSGVARAGLRRRGVQRAGRRRRLHERLPARLAARRCRWSAAASWPTPAAPSWSRATAARRPCRPGRSWRPSWQPRPRPFRLREDAELEHMHWATTRRRDLSTALRAGHRPPQPVRGAGRRAGRRRGAHRRLQARWRCRRWTSVAGGDPRFGILLDGRFGVRRAGRRRRTIRTGSAGRSRSRSRGRWNSRAAPTWRPSSPNGR